MEYLEFEKVINGIALFLFVSRNCSTIFGSPIGSPWIPQINHNITVIEIYIMNKCI